MFGKLKKWGTKKVLESQMKNVPPEQQALIMEMLENNPELFEKIAKEIQEETKKTGGDQQAISMKVFMKYQQEIVASLSPQTKEMLMKMQMGSQGKFNPNGSIRR